MTSFPYPYNLGMASFKRFAMVPRPELDSAGLSSYHIVPAPRAAFLMALVRCVCVRSRASMGLVSLLVNWHAVATIAVGSYS